MNFVGMTPRRWSVAGSLFAVIAMMSVNACKHGVCKDGGTSSHGSDRSHNMGQNCQSCHHPDGPGEVCWQVAGTAYDSISGNTSPNVTVRLYTQPNEGGELRMTLEGDGYGNFYTSQDPGTASGLFPTVTTANGHTSRMQERITTGACNSCHGVTTARIRVH